MKKTKLLAALVRSFFDAFSSGVIDTSDVPVTERRKPKNVKQTMLDHYGHIAPAFFDTMFFPLAAMNFSYEDIERVVREAQQRGDDMMALVKTACASDAMYNMMVDEYKSNFTALLGGRCLTVADHLATRSADVDMETAADFDTDRAIELTVRVVMHAYARGLRQTDNGMSKFRQPTLFRLLLDAMNVLLCDEAADYSDCDDDLSEMFLKVCHNEHNFAVMTAEMDRTHGEIIDK